MHIVDGTQCLLLEFLPTEMANASMANHSLRKENTRLHVELDSHRKDGALDQLLAQAKGTDEQVKAIAR